MSEEKFLTVKRLRFCPDCDGATVSGAAEGRKPFDARRRLPAQLSSSVPSRQRGGSVTSLPLALMTHSWADLVLSPAPSAALPSPSQEIFCCTGQTKYTLEINLPRVEGRLLQQRCLHLLRNLLLQQVVVRHQRRRTGPRSDTPCRSSPS